MDSFNANTYLLFLDDPYLHTIPHSFKNSKLLATTTTTNKDKIFY